MAKKYRKWGKVWEVFQSSGTGSWYAGCKRRGYSDAVLDKLGTAPSCDAMQVKLDVWARRNGAGVVGHRPVEQMRLF